MGFQAEAGLTRSQLSVADSVAPQLLRSNRIVSIVQKGSAAESDRQMRVQGLCVPDGDADPGAATGLHHWGGADFVCRPSIWTVEAGRH